MKKRIYIIALLGFFSFMTMKAQAQYKVFRLVQKSTGKCLTREWSTHPTIDLLYMRDKNTGENEVSQLFIIKRISGSNEVYIISASDHNMYLRPVIPTASSSSIRLDRDLAYPWQLQFAGGSVYITKASKSGVLKVMPDDKFGWVEELPKLSNLNDPLGDSFRFLLEEVTNTF
ncbi:hypothetical protein [Xanthovirga aplysinae]|uniref:hypothetical protein n=1 Tax=Xanthovirga aplysinae TaxID=2529853 RepID=UPI0012BCEF2B|nr:hypothetical protein [Xanthovirga aplysinae]MTI29621.1 hypothetical protein [Xanthovirga aplysinae]